MFHRVKKKNDYTLRTGALLWKRRFDGDRHGETGDAGVRTPRTGGMAEDLSVLTPASGVRHRGARALPST